MSKKRFFALLVVAVLVISVTMPFYSGKVNTAYAKDEVAVATKGATEGNVLIVTQDMVNKNGVLFISGEWDRIEVPKEIQASRIVFRGVKTKCVEIESGNKSKVEMTSGEFGEVVIVPAKVEEMTVQELAELIRLTEDSASVIAKYREQKAKNDAYRNTRPTLITGKNVVVGNLNVSGNVKLDLGKGAVENVKVDADGSQKELNVNISNYEGNVSVKQTEREDGSWMVARVKLNNSKVEKLTVEGEGRGNIVLSGQKTEVKDVKVESAPMVSLNVPAEKVEIGETAKDVVLSVLAEVKEMLVAASDAKIEVGSCGSVEDADVDGNNVQISGDGAVADVEIKGEGVAVSTQGTKVEGENAYVPPVVVTPPSEPETPPESGDTEVRDLGGLEVVIGYHYDPQETQDAALQSYREEMMQKHNFTVREAYIADFGEMEHTYQTSIKMGQPAAQVFVLTDSFLEDGRDLFYDLSTLSELDFSEEKWNDNVREMMSYGDGIYGMSIGYESDTVAGIIFNKRLLEDAGIDPELLYDLQKSGEWTWSKFLELCEKLTRDVDGDGVTDIYATGSNGADLIDYLICSCGLELFDIKDGKYVNNLGTDEVLAALNFAQKLADFGYEFPREENTSWDYYIAAFREGKVAMHFGRPYQTYSYSDFGEMQDELGFVTCPKPDAASSRRIWNEETQIAVIPACYDAQTAADIAFAYNIWTNPVPGQEFVDTVWENAITEYKLDERAIKETIELYRQDENSFTRCGNMIIDEMEIYQDLHWLYPLTSGSWEEVITNILPTYSALIGEKNIVKKLDVVAPRPNGTEESLFDKYPFSFEVYEDKTLAITQCKDYSIKELVIPEEIGGYKITEIAGNAFSGCEELENVVLPDGLEKIGDFAFMDCSKLETVVLPESLQEIGEAAFSNCICLVKIDLPNGLQILGERAFMDCVSMGAIRIPDTLKEIRRSSFLRCDGLEEIMIPGGVAIIGENAFSACDNLEKVVLENGVSEIGEYAFFYCPMLREATIPASVTEIGEGAFEIVADDFTIITEKGSSAEAYASENGISVKYIGE